VPYQARYAPDTGVPIVVTLHLPLPCYSKAATEALSRATVVNCVSNIQLRERMLSSPAVRVIENGVAVEELPRDVPRKSFALALGRICPEKGFHMALDAAALAGVEFRLAGQVYPYEAHQSYFEREIAPRLDRRRRFIGPAGWERKCELLSAARCLLVPSLIAETSSLVAMEALSCGTPVIAFPSGALVDIVEHGKTGFLVNDVGEMARAIELSKSIDPRLCRMRARQRFSTQRMTTSYVGMYQSLASSRVHGAVNEHSPI
jgi:glycosyltransferase involved in cell wall biosynthesis